MKPIPGQVTAAFITPECRLNHGNDGAWDEAVRRLRDEYDAILHGWRKAPRQPTLNLILHMERPQQGGETTPNHGATTTKS